MLKPMIPLLAAIFIIVPSVNGTDALSTQGPLDSCMRAALVVGLAGFLGHMLGKKIDHEDIGANIFAIVGMALDHYLLGGKEDPCSFARIMGYVVMAFARGAYEKRREQQQERYIMTTSVVV